MYLNCTFGKHIVRINVPVRLFGCWQTFTEIKLKNYEKIASHVASNNEFSYH